MDGDDSNTAFSSKDIGETVFTDTEPWDLFHAIDDWPGLLEVQYEIQEERRGAEQSRRDEALNAARARLRDVDRRSELCKDHDGWGSLTARTIDKNANIWKRAGEPDAPSTNAANRARGYLRDPSVGRELWHIAQSPSRCHSAQRIAEAVFFNTDGEPLEQYLSRPHTPPPPDEEQLRRDGMLAEAGPADVAVTAGPDAAETPARTQPRSVTSQVSPLTHVAAVVKSTDPLWRGQGHGDKEFSAAQIVRSTAPRSTKKWYAKNVPSRLYSPAEIGNVVYLDTGGRKLRDFIRLTNTYGALATGGGRGGSHDDDDDDDNDDPSPNDLRFDFASTTPWWYREIAAGYVGRNAKSAQDIFNGSGVHQVDGPSWNADDYQWVKQAEDDEGEHQEDAKGRRYSAAELGNAIFADTGGETLSDFLQRGQAGRPHRTRRKRTKRRRPRSRGVRGLHRRTRAHKNRKKNQKKTRRQRR